MEALIPVLVDFLPPWAVNALAYVTVVMAFLTALGKALNAIVPRLREYAATTPSRDDDRAVERVALLADVLGWLNQVIPHAIIGTHITEARASKTPSWRPPPSGALALVLLALASGCAATPIEKARTALDVVSTTVRGAESITDVAYVDPLLERCTARLESGEDTTTLEWSECTAGARKAGLAFSDARAAIFAIELGVDAAEREEGEDAICNAIDPLAAVIPKLIEVLEDHGVDVPAVLTQYVPVVAGMIGAMCDAEDDEEAP